MKRIGFLKIMLLLAFVSISTNNVFAANYKLYSPDENKSYSAQMLTIGNGSGGYYIGLYSGINLCVIDKNVNVNSKGLVGGDCYSFDGAIKYNWREFVPNTYKNEVKEIILERNQDGMRPL